MRFVFKVGTSLLTATDGTLDLPLVKAIVAQLAAIAKKGHEVVVVSSGAVAAGRRSLRFSHEKKNIPYRQALAAVGQGILVETYRAFFKKHGIAVAQALLTNYDFTNRENFLNTKNVVSLLLSKGVIPVVNENDVTTIAELKFGDNDMLSAKTAAMVSADYLCIITDVDGLFSADPKANPNAKIVPLVSKVNDSVRSFAGGARSASSLGGMVTKLEATAYVTSAGISMWIVNGHRKNILEEVVLFCAKREKEREVVGDFDARHGLGTFFPSSVNALESQKKWLKPKLLKDAYVKVDAGAEQALLRGGKSLLPSGVAAVHGKFSRGDVVMVKGPTGDIGYGQVNYDAKDIDVIKKCHTRQIEERLGFCFEEEIIHRDRMVILA